VLRVQIQDGANGLTLKLEGRFTADAAENTRVLVTRLREGMRFVLDLTDVTFIDSAGEDVLSFFGRFGAEFVAPTSYTLDTCERLNLQIVREELPTVPKRPGSNHSRQKSDRNPSENEVV